MKSKTIFRLLINPRGVGATLSLAILLFWIFWPRSERHVTYGITERNNTMASIERHVTTNIIRTAERTIPPPPSTIGILKEAKETAGELDDRNVLIVWSNYLPIPSAFETKIHELASSNPKVTVTVFCGSLRCEEQILALKMTNAKTVRLLLRDLSKGTPLQKPIYHSPLYSYRLGENFLSLTHHMGVLLALWIYGGLYLNLKYSIPSPLPNDFFVGEWLGSKGMFTSCRFKKRSSFVNETMAKIVSKNAYNEDLSVWDYDSVVSELNHGLQSKPSGEREMAEVMPSSKRDHYGFFCYTGVSHNMGDLLQSWATVQFFPYLDRCVNRNDWTLSAVRGGQSAGLESGPVTMIVNGKYNDEILQWPPPSHINPFLISMHVSSSFSPKLITTEGSRFLQQHGGTVGARDPFTLNKLMELNIDSYLSGCLTLLLTNPFSHLMVDMEMLAVDVDEGDFEVVVPKDPYVRILIIKSSHEVDNIDQSSMRDAYVLLQRYARARCLITSRLSVAMAGVGMGTPVVFVNSNKLKGGDHARLEGFLDLFHTATLHGEGAGRRVSGLEGFDWFRPPRNPNAGKAMRLRATLWHALQKRSVFRESAITFGVVPLSRPETPIKSELSFFLLSSSQTLTMLERRSIESIFHHHPYANVFIYSKTLNQSQLQLFVEVGYSAHVVNYNWSTLLHQLEHGDTLDHLKPTADFMKTFQIMSMHDGWHDFDKATLLPILLMLYMQGGVFMDTNSILLKPLTLLQNSVAKTSKSGSLDKSIMNFETRSSFLGECINEYLQFYETFDPKITLAELVTKSAARYSTQVCNFDDGKSKTTNLGLSQGVDSQTDQADFKECFLTKLGDDFALVLNNAESNEECQRIVNGQNFHEIARRYSVAIVTVNNSTASQKSKPGTLCHRILNRFCVFCDEYI